MSTFSFGSTGTFGAAATQNKPTFGATGTTGFSFGASTQPSSTPSFGFGATTSTTSTAPNFSFGSNFGAPASSAPTGFGTLGASTSTTGAFGGFGSTTTTPSTGFGFGATSTSGATTGFSFGAPATSAPTFGGFGSLTTSQPSTGLGTFSSFGSTPASTGSSLFGGLGTSTNTGTSTFGTGTGLGTFGAKPAGTTFSFGSSLVGGTGLGTSFGTGTTFGSTLGQSTFQQPQQQQQPPQDPNQLIANAVLNVRIFGDERDTILAKWNLLQAAWGVGKGYYAQNQPPVTFTPENPYCRFKAIAYSAMPGKDNKDGQVILVFNKKESEVKSQLQQIHNTITANIFGNKPEFKVCIDELKSLNEDSTEIIMYVEEKNNMGNTRKIPANDLSNFLNQTMQKQQLTNMGVQKVFPNIKPDSEQIQEYLKQPPSGIDPRIWKQAQEDNPNPEKYLPVPIIGFNQLKWRLQIQESETALHQAYLDQVTDDIAALKQKQTASVAQIAEYKRKFLDLQHRVLKILVKQEMSRKVNVALQPEEEQLRIQLENMHAQISIPTQFKGRLTELLAHIRILRSGEEPVMGTGSVERYKLNPAVQEDIKQFLEMEQICINHLIETIHNDMATLNKIKEGMLRILQS